MTAVAKARTHRQFAGQKEILVIVWDASLDTSCLATGAYDLFTSAEAGVITDFHAQVDTLCVSAGGGTISVGKSGDAAGIMAATAAQAAGVCIDAASFGTSYKLTAADVVQMTIGTAAYTAGKIRFVFELYKFA